MFAILAISVLVFAWGSTNYVMRNTDTPDILSPELYVPNIDAFAIPAVISAFVTMVIIPTIVYTVLKNRIQRIILVPVAAVGIFSTFAVILGWIVANPL